MAITSASGTVKVDSVQEAYGQGASGAKVYKVVGHATATGTGGVGWTPGDENGRFEITCLATPPTVGDTLTITIA